MRARAIEWRPDGGHGWAALAPDQLEAGQCVVVGVRDDPELLTPRLRECLPPEAGFIRPGPDSIRVIFGEVRASDTDEMREWLDCLFPDVIDVRPDVPSHPLDELARVLCDFHDDRLLSIGARGLAWGSLTRMRLGVPVFSDGNVTLIDLTVLVVGAALIVCWHDAEAEALEVTSRIDGEARGRQYGDAEGGAVHEVASMYVASSLSAYPRVATMCSRGIDAWEMSYVESLASGQALAGQEAFRTLSQMRSNVVRLQAGLDDIEHGRTLTLADLWWSTADGPKVVTPAVRTSLEQATHSIDRLRTDVSDSVVMASVAGTMQQLRVAHDSQARFTRLQEAVARLTAFLIAPGLVATVFGANVALPGSGGGRLVFMIVGMLGTAALTYLLLSRLSGRGGESEPWLSRVQRRFGRRAGARRSRA